MTLILLMIPAALAGCDTPSDVSAISVDVSSAQLAMASLDVEAIGRSAADARQVLPCLAVAINPMEAAAYHGLMGLDSFVAGDEEASLLSFRSAISVMPDYRLPPIIAPAGGPLDAVLSAARTAVPSETKALPPFDGIVLIDGSRAFVRPMGRPVIIQLVTKSGKVSETHYVGAPDDLPRWDPPPTAFQRILPTVREKPSVPIGIAAASTAVCAGTLYALGGAWHEQYLDPSTPYGELDGLQTRTNAALGGSIALTVAATALTTFTFVRW